ncbi:IS30 family transposase [[Mycobacterium] wendilense]|uniref:IS30 family transposase n=1 Tax=[Mycobacterium] wendilense TaxID=3064284 RepID=A0ABN9P008_9MYCO|nr:IS30 family transposase [Mycolicibacterium sp. MU0050]CAJ1581175.1 IS30 family transposase [Mycolicibacterium sp. MU0050]CAJ1581665.1 IS30 family transposase [Mycolicibacterium sp. MU0050]CAJ1584857.1 IS30 family transposase [Mycolicibacterium sp. MU0050]CAJ1586415.1 IS30 family transposase [Mycolicibacterium sp. MU0050]
MGLPELARVESRFWELIRDGLSPRDAGKAVGVSGHTGYRWFADVGGVKPPPRDDGPRKKPRLSFEEREEIALGIAAGESMCSIARRLKRAPSTISREIKNNSKPGRNRYRSRYQFGARWHGGHEQCPRYRASSAHARSQRRARRAKPGKLATNRRLHAEVQTRLEDDQHSPEQIARRLQIDFPDDPEMRVSHETIYQAIYVQGKGNLRRELHTCLRTGRALRKPQRRPDERRGKLRDIVSISERPPEVEDRAVPGHWEGDLILGSVASASAIGTVVERTTRFTMLLHLPDRHTAEAVQEAIVTKMAQLPTILRKTLTWDRGHEMANHAAIATAAELDIYFCDPHSPWQRGTNENTNGLLRQYFAKSTDLSVFPADYLDYVAAKLNNRPRKTLRWKTPAEALDELLSNPFKSPAVASTA